MEQNKKEIMLEQISKIEDVLKILQANFDCENEIPDEYSFLTIVKEKLQNLTEE